jgi:uncharacterized protein (TIGR02145 family)
MKRFFLFVTAIASLLFTSCKKDKDKYELGEVSFATNQTWTVGNQIWSDAVTATGCNKTDFDGGVDDFFKSDCRSNPDFKGDLFSWEMVIQYGDKLCPAPWRVPTQQDFIDLDITLGGTGLHRDALQFINDHYLNSEVWGGTYNGYYRSESGLSQVTDAYYWSSSIPWDARTTAFFFNFRSSGYIYTRISAKRNWGMSLRCVQ